MVKTISAPSSRPYANSRKPELKSRMCIRFPSELWCSALAGQRSQEAFEPLWPQAAGARCTPLFLSLVFYCTALFFYSTLSHFGQHTEGQEIREEFHIRKHRLASVPINALLYSRQTIYHWRIKPISQFLRGEALPIALLGDHQIYEKSICYGNFFLPNFQMLMLLLWKNW